MAVRRVSDLPNLDAIYENSQLSDCLLEVSYTPNKDASPRLYQSFYEYGSSLAIKVGHYLSNQFITPDDLADLGIGDLADLVNMLNALLNTEDLYLFVAQCGAPYSVINGTGAIRYDVIELRNGDGEKIGKTLVWKSDPNNLTPGFNSNYYTASKHDIIFFKTVADAMKAAQRFKFLEGAGIKIKICTDLVEPLSLTFSVQSNKVKIKSVTLMNKLLSHSDSCALDISGTKINSMQRVYSKQTKKLEYCKIAFTYQMRTIYRDSYSLYNTRYQYFMSSSLQTTYSYLLFDAGERSNNKYDNVTFANRCIDASSDRANFNVVAFLKHEFAVLGYNVYMTNCSCSKCGTCLHIIGGNRSQIQQSFEALSCTYIVYNHEAGTFIRDKNINGLVYIKSTVSNSSLARTESNGIVFIDTAIDYAPSQSNQFISADIKSTEYSASDWKDVSYNEMTAYVVSHEPCAQSLEKFAVNPLHNALVIDEGDSRKQYVYDCSIDDFQNFMQSTTGNSPSKTPLTSNTSYSGPTTSDGYMKFRLNEYQQTVVSYSNLYNNYDTERFNPTSRLRSAFAHANLETMTNIWSNDRYQSNYADDSQFYYDLANKEKFTVTVANDPDTGESSRQYEILNDAAPISPAGYSLQQYRIEDHTTNYSFDEIDYNNDFKQLTSTMQIEYGYSITQA